MAQMLYNLPETKEHGNTHTNPCQGEETRRQSVVLHR